MWMKKNWNITGKICGIYKGKLPFSIYGILPHNETKYIIEKRGNQ